MATYMNVYRFPSGLNVDYINKFLQYEKAKLSHAF